VTPYYCTGEECVYDVKKEDETSTKVKVLKRKKEIP